MGLFIVHKEGGGWDLTANKTAEKVSRYSVFVGYLVHSICNYMFFCEKSNYTSNTSHKNDDIHYIGS